MTQSRASVPALEFVVQLDAHQERRRHGVGRDLTRGVLAAYSAITDWVVHALDKVARPSDLALATDVDRASQAVTFGTTIVSDRTEDVFAEHDRFPGAVRRYPSEARIDLIPGRSLVVRACEEIAVLGIAPRIADRRFELTEVGRPRVEHVDRNLVLGRVGQLITM